MFYVFVSSCTPLLWLDKFMPHTSIILCVADARFLPAKKTPEAVCRDLCTSVDIEIAPGQIILAPTGVKIACSAGRHTRIYARSGLPIKSGLILANSVWVMDNDYRGEYFLQLYNWTTTTVTHTAWTRLCQFDIAPYYLPWQPLPTTTPLIETIIDPDVFERFAELYPTERGEGCFHSTGR